MNEDKDRKKYEEDENEEITGVRESLLFDKSTCEIRAGRIISCGRLQSMPMRRDAACHVSRSAAFAMRR